jgi:hypothetical protein
VRPHADTERDAEIRLGVHVTSSSVLVRGDRRGTGGNVPMEDPSPNRGRARQPGAVVNRIDPVPLRSASTAL